MIDVVCLCLLRAYIETKETGYKSRNYQGKIMENDFPDLVDTLRRYSFHHYKLPTIRSASFGLESLSFMGSFLWNTLDESIKNEPTLLAFKNKIKIVREKNAPAGSAANLLF